jgi:hypothetical protein
VQFAECFPALNFVKIYYAFQKSNGANKSKAKMMVMLPSQKGHAFNCSDSVKILDLLKKSMSLAEVGWYMVKHTQYSTELYSS